MAFTPSDLQDIIYNPYRVQKEVLDLVSRGTNNNITISDATNPFVFLLESSAILASSSIIESNSIIRKKYPILADKEEDIYHHISNNILDQIYTIPAEAVLYFYVNQVDLYNVGYRPDNADYVQTTIPSNTVIKVSDIPLTLLNDITVKLYDNGEINVEQQLNTDNEFAYDDIGTLNAKLWHSKDNTPWIVFMTKVKQIDITNINKTILTSDGFKQIIPITDNYCYSLVSYKNTNTNSAYVKLPISLNDEYIDANTPTAYVKVYNKNILVEIPDVYILEGLVSGNINIDIYSSKGSLDVPIDRFKTDDFTITLGNTSKNSSTATIKNIGLLCNAAQKLQGGRDSKTLDELKTIVINDSGVTKNTPITIKQVEGMLSNNGYKLVNNFDILTSREFIAMKSLPEITSDLTDIIFAKPDIFINTVELDMSKLLNNDFIYFNNSDYIVIKSNSVFKEDNGKVYPISTADYNNIKSLFNTNKIRLFNELTEVKHFYNPYYYIIEIQNELTNIKIYDLDNPSITNIRIDNKNNNITPSCNIDKYAIEKIESGYRLYVTLAPNSEFSNLMSNTIKLQLRLPLFQGGNYAYIDGNYNTQLDLYQFDIITDMIIDKNEYLTITNANYIDTPTMKLLLNNDWNIYTITSDVSITDNTYFLSNEIYNPNKEKLTVVTKETLTISLGDKLEHLYYNLYSVYTTKKYKTYTEDQPLKYKYNIYSTDEFGYPFTCNKLELDHEITCVIKHPKGSTVKDSEGNTLYKFKKGDIILDENNEPIIDQVSGIVRYLDMLLLEYEFKLANTTEYINYLVETNKTLKSYITTDMVSFNNKLLENTTIYYKPYNISKKINITINNINNSINYIIQPTVTLYLTNNVTYTSLEQNVIKSEIGNIINKELDNSIVNLENIRKNIKTKLGNNVVSVKLDNITDLGLEVITLNDSNRRLTLGKKLRQDENFNCLVDYDIILQFVNV